MASCVLVLRNTFRLHDNPALHYALQDARCKTIFIPIDSARVLAPHQCIPTIQGDVITHPRFYTYTTANHYAWGYHQYYLLLHVIRTFIDDVHKHYPQFTVIVAKDTVENMFKTFIRKHAKCVYDQVDDPAWDVFDEALHKHFSAPQQLQCLVTHTLLDWRTPDHKTFLDSWSPRRHNKSFKDYVFSQSFEFDTELAQTDCRTKPTRGGGRALKKKTTRKCTRKRKPRIHHQQATKRTQTTRLPFNVSTEICAWRKVMRKNNIVPYEPPVNTTCEQWALDQLATHASTMATNTWEKPKTQSVLSLREYGTKPQHTTSKLSPFFALGALSAKYAYVQWQGRTTQQHKQNASRPSSAIAQLLWREEFHACSLVDGFWHTRDDDATTRFWKRDKEWDIWLGDDARLQPFLHAQATEPPKSKKTKTKTKNSNRKGKPKSSQSQHTDEVLMEDTNSSLRMLARDGWIHHLRRHTVADYLTRGHLDADWMLGESWFRQTLLDHDASVNRGNWLWLSACDFSTKQLCMHYSHDTYVRRQSGLKV